MPSRSAAASPFGPRGAFLLTEERLEALSRLLFVIEHRRSLAVVSGPTGIGKTRLLDELALQCRPITRRVISLDASGLTAHELPSALLAACQVWHEGDATAWQALEDVITGGALAGHAGVWIVDHIDRAAGDLTSSLSRLVQLLSRRDVAGTAILSTSDSEALPRLVERDGWRIELSPWTADDAAAALELMQESTAGPQFSSAALQLIAEAANGSPAATLQLCELSVLAATLHGVQIIDAELARDACRQRMMSGRGDFWQDSEESALATLWRD